MNVPMLTTDFLDRGVELYDDVTAVVADDGTEYTYAEFDDRVNKLSNALLDAGLEQGDKVALISGNTHYFLETQFAVQQLGMVFVPINYRLIADEYEYILNDCEAELVIADHAYAGEIEPIREDVPADRFVGYGADRIDGEWDEYEDILQSGDSAAPDRPDIDEEDDASINYTSGTRMSAWTCSVRWVRTTPFGSPVVPEV